MVQPRPRAALDSRRIDRTSRPIDLVHLARQTMGDRSLECEVLRMFETQVELYFERVAATGDAEQISLGLHTLKGAALSVGAMGVAAQAKAAEDEFRISGRIEEETLADLGMAVSEVVSYIGSILSD